MRIIAGVWKGRNLEAPKDDTIRPTSARLREALFNILAHHFDPSPLHEPVLDLCCGTGALGLEALSRGTPEAWFVDSSPVSLALTRRNIARVQAESRAHTLQADLRRLPPAPRAFGLVLFDPPYRTGLIETGLQQLSCQNWLQPGASLWLEMGLRDAIALPEGFAPLLERQYGKSKLVGVEYSGTE
jgi:16S rRNA (guanine966-N2)-methyltransferase